MLALIITLAPDETIVRKTQCWTSEGREGQQEDGMVELIVSMDMSLSKYGVVMDEWPESEKSGTAGD